MEPLNQGSGSQESLQVPLLAAAETTYFSEHTELNLRAITSDHKTIENLCSCFDWDLELQGKSV